MGCYCPLLAASRTFQADVKEDSTGQKGVLPSSTGRHTTEPTEWVAPTGAVGLAASGGCAGPACRAGGNRQHREGDRGMESRERELANLPQRITITAAPLTPSFTGHRETHIH